MWHTAGREWVVHAPEFVGDELDPDRASALWAGHRWFAYDLVRWGRPDLLVELGTQYGPSFFTFCQAVRDEGLRTSVHAIDSWEGDTFTGGYGDEVLGIVKRVRAEAFADLDAHLHQCRFRDALDEFDDASIDLLHIDGCHDYEAVAGDYESWLPKVATNGLVMFHDVDPGTDMGSARFWGELAPTQPSFAFPHSLGLGVLFPKGTDGFEYLFGPEFDRWRAYYPSRAGDFLGTLRYRDQSRMIDERDELLREYENTIEAQQLELEERTRYARDLEDQLQHPVVRVANRARRAVTRAPQASPADDPGAAGADG
jgi:hypothetical protein